MRKPIIAGNWKMNKTIAEALDFAKQLEGSALSPDVDAVICAPYLSLQSLVEVLRPSAIKVGAQNLHFEDAGAFTGEVSAQMLREIGVDYVIIGHSERRQYFGETDETVNKKLIKALASELIPILCVGESLEERETGKTNDVIEGQIKKGLQNISAEEIERVVIAYEPIWAIGTGKTATSEQANEVCVFIRKILAELFGTTASERVRIQYGGSVKPSNIKEIMEQSDIDGALVGGASLIAEDYLQLVNY